MMVMRRTREETMTTTANFRARNSRKKEHLLDRAPFLSSGK